MMGSSGASPEVAIACGGTGGHLFPGLAVATELQRRGCNVSLLVSAKEIDQQAVKSAPGFRVLTLPAVGLTRRHVWAFCRGFAKSYLTCRRVFRQTRPAIALGMGGFTAAPPLIAARRCGAAVFIHESNRIPGRANRWLARIADVAFIGFAGAGERLNCRDVLVTGTPVRPEFSPGDGAESKVALGFNPDLPLILVMGGSQGAEGINSLVLRSLPYLRKSGARVQWLHLTGPKGAEAASQAYRDYAFTAHVYSFSDRMHLALSAATLAISRSGASSLAEIAATQTPAILIPFPHATDNHQWHNADAFHQSGAAVLLEQSQASPEALAGLIVEVLGNEPRRQVIQQALTRWHRPDAAAVMSDRMLEYVEGARTATHQSQSAPPLKKRASVIA
jgi:UDP-N-acetylglucosamine--N-acetylmuramyl-(pentapeptide) pyrophosphoryl-undecaprenol N-acetylglucosamine transferase